MQDMSEFTRSHVETADDLEAIGNRMSMTTAERGQVHDKGQKRVPHSYFDFHSPNCDTGNSNTDNNDNRNYDTVGGRRIMEKNGTYDIVIGLYRIYYNRGIISGLYRDNGR